MTKRLKDYNNEFPIWLWLDKTNLWLSQFLDDEWVLLEINIDEEKVLLSSFDAWHVVLNISTTIILGTTLIIDLMKIF